MAARNSQSKRCSKRFDLSFIHIVSTLGSTLHLIQEFLADILSCSYWVTVFFFIPITQPSCQWWSHETHFCKSRSRGLQVWRLWILQGNGLVKFLQFNDFCLLYLQVRNNQHMSVKC